MTKIKTKSISFPLCMCGRCICGLKKKHFDCTFSIHNIQMIVVHKIFCFYSEINKNIEIPTTELIFWTKRNFLDKDYVANCNL